MGMAAQAYNSSIWQEEVGESRVQGHPLLHIEVKVNLGETQDLA